jgi:hypothetical protein
MPPNAKSKTQIKTQIKKGAGNCVSSTCSKPSRTAIYAAPELTSAEKRAADELFEMIKDQVDLEKNQKLLEQFGSVPKLTSPKPVPKPVQNPNSKGGKKKDIKKVNK